MNKTKTTPGKAWHLLVRVSNKHDPTYPAYDKWIPVRDCPAESFETANEHFRVYNDRPARFFISMFSEGV